MALITEDDRDLAVIDDDLKLCLHCPTLVDIEEDGYRDSNGRTVCAACYHNGTAYVEQIDYELDGGR